ncbi:cellobiose dehydrogenase [Rhizoctonia solani AG-3 Rhs1AP]|uniref:Cellobiose dehydrogenase n=1 Tax=Rhizoctonia solani AG-3 Rhs1AP TaxID=1086054 RepID=X8IZH8_9AGAM|nr:cellobiose dehydrogenase [Rhizoctonia solani AG-3 Rhs1AP]
MLSTFALLALYSSLALGKSHYADDLDYIIVGSGPAGIVAADRLSEAGKKVLLLERGGPSISATGGTDTPPWPYPTNLTRFDMPAGFQTVFSGTPYFMCTDLPARGGCLVGGGAAINGMLYWYPRDEDFATSNGWPKGWQNIEPHLKKVKARLPSNDIASADGKRYLTEVYDVFKGVLDAQGYKTATINNQRNKKDKVYGYTAFSSQKGIRVGPMGTYLQTALARPNFEMLLYTKVLAVARNGSTITGVYTNNTQAGDNGFISLKPKGGRVILSGGAFGSSRILFQSGIGPADVISTVEATPDSAQYLPPKSSYISLPVGYHITDNPAINIVFTHPTIQPYLFGGAWTDPVLSDAKQYVEEQSGKLAQTSARINWWKKYSGSDGRDRWMQGTARPGGCCGSNANTSFALTLYLGTGIDSTGRIGMKSDTSVSLIANPWLQSSGDREALVAAAKDVIASYQNVSDLVLTYPNLSSTTIEEHVTGSNHWTGSTRIGTDSSTSVVDSNLQVWGTNNLFIIDAGVIPGMPVGNPTGTILTMAEMASAKLLELK